ncbi:Bug family tripartite tricarboxylate transporter substrate binding protein [Siccirubricoccus deserti]|uniref:Tripartite tricarboxylate transporter substrate binding protein n=1 Tax=Siccirubricoccus deserti TaxID=2013562 RepID=A0A9X0QWT2_9PROT|nr:tripartite tricarboxylate transporter substrate binding protein [Siccirubricoccus deserti]MBC4014328.1 tripartite tricarboxylate transporter substrate binding protein [Siccirubricoccus deserti]
MLRRRALPLALAPLLAARPAAAQAWPSKPLRMVIPWPPGQATDVIGRMIANLLTASLGQPVVPENRPGAGGMIGTDAVAKSVPDGHTLLSASIGPITFGPLVNRTPYDVARELAPVVSFGLAPYMLLVKPSFPATDARSFVALVKGSPSKYTFPSSGIGGAQHLLTAMFNARAGLDALHVPFQGSGPAMAALLAGQVDYAIDTPAAANALVRDGSLRVLGQSLGKPSALLPGVPPLAEAADVPGYDIGGWNGLMVAAATPRPIIERLFTEVRQGLATTELRDRFASIGMEVGPLGPEQFATMLRDQQALFGPLIRQLGIRAE